MTATSDAAFRFTGRLSALDTRARKTLFNRSASTDPGVSATVRNIIDRVRLDGDAALLELARRFDRVRLEKVEVAATTIDVARASLTPELESALLRSARNIKAVHAAALPVETRVEVEEGVTVCRRPDPLRRVGIYAPGGTAAYASSVLMAAVPAKVAGVDEIILCSPPSKETGLPSEAILAAARIAGVDRVFAVGGAGAIAAMALGTESIPRVDKIVGPGNAFVAEAKVQLTSEVGIDCPAGPSELLVIADETATPEVIAREVVAQAEHDERAVVVVIAIGSSVGGRIEAAIAAAVGSQPRQAIIVKSLGERGGVLVVDTIDEAIDAATSFAPEHLMVATKNAPSVASKVRCAGSIFIGETSSVSFGDYISGANHVLPTGGMGRAYSGLSTLDFIRWTTTQTISQSAAARFADDTSVFAIAEGLPGHAAAAKAWSDR
jgi:histidinol dehydrogenase